MKPRSFLGLDGKETLGLGVVAAVVAISLLVFSGVLQSTVKPSGTTVRAQFDTTGRLSTGDPVRVDGVRVGQVKDVALGADHRTAEVELEVLDDALPVYADARAVIRWRTLLGGAYAVDLDRGSPRAGELGDRPIVASRTDDQVELDEILTTFRTRQVAGMKTLLSELPVALAEPDEPGRVLDGLDRVSPTATVALRALRGRHEGDLRDLVVDAARTVRAIDGPSEPLRDVVEGAAATLRTTARREADIRATLARGARVLPQAQSTLTRLDVTLRNADPLIEELDAPARKLAPALDELRPVLSDADTLLTRARPLLTSLRPAVSSLARAARTATPLLAALRPSVERLDDRILPALAKRDAVSGRPAYQMIGPTFAGLTSVASRFDSGGHLVKLSAQFGERPFQTAPCMTFLTDPSKEQIVSCELITQAIQDLPPRTRP